MSASTTSDTLIRFQPPYAQPRPMRAAGLCLDDLDDGDVLRGARGVIFGLAASLAFWASVIVSVVFTA